MLQHPLPWSETADLAQAHTYLAIGCLTGRHPKRNTRLYSADPQSFHACLGRVSLKYIMPLFRDLYPPNKSI